MSRTKLTTALFIEKARRVYGDVYDYSRSEYTFSKDKIKVKCPSHGVWEPTANNHMKGKSSCPQCAGKYSPTTQEFIRSCIEVHGDKYDY